MAQKLWLPKKVIKALQPVEKPTVQEERPPCPKCNSNLHVRKNGFKKGRQMWRCNVCHSGYYFPYATVETREENSRTEKRKRTFGLRNDHTVELPFYDCSNMLKKMSRPLPSLDSVFGIPCFLCSEANRGCNPNSCPKIESYLLKEVDLNGLQK